VGGFGWNFYGFFIFCFVWIAGYFLWARRTTHQAPTRHPAPSSHSAPGTRHRAP